MSAVLEAALAGAERLRAENERLTKDMAEQLDDSEAIIAALKKERDEAKSLLARVMGSDADTLASTAMLLERAEKQRDEARDLYRETEERLARERAAHDKTEAELEKLLDGLEAAWGVIANASGGDWTRESAGWQGAAARWRDGHWHPAFSRWGERWGKR